MKNIFRKLFQHVDNCKFCCVKNYNKHSESEEHKMKIERVEKALVLLQDTFRNPPELEKMRKEMFDEQSKDMVVTVDDCKWQFEDGPEHCIWHDLKLGGAYIIRYDKQDNSEKDNLINFLDQQFPGVKEHFEKDELIDTLYECLQELEAQKLVNNNTVFETIKHLHMKK